MNQELNLLFFCKEFKIFFNMLIENETIAGN
jgi:hypothetical protein